jgi:hypothetical protein
MVILFSIACYPGAITHGAAGINLGWIFGLEFAMFLVNGPGGGKIGRLDGQTTCLVRAVPKSGQKNVGWTS